MNKLVAIFLVSMLSIAAASLFEPKPDSELLKKLVQQQQRSAKDQPSVRHGDSVPKMVQDQGYPIEVHTIVTEDCYELEMHRIPYGRQSPPEVGVTKPVVYLQHGLLCSSADWVMGIPSKFLGYILADAGYDVWMGNYRGNLYSRKHCTLNPDRDDEFWHFSWDHNGYYDIPAMIQKINIVTGVDRIHYVGHSMGTTGFMVMADQRPQFLDKIIMANLLAPVAYVEHMKSPIRLLAPFVDDVEWIATHLGDGEFLPSTWLTGILAEVLCGDWLPLACESIMFLLCGFDPAQTNETLLPTIIHHTPAGASTFQVLQYGQEIYGGFHAYDFGEDNQAHYGQDTPIDFANFETFNVPISLYWSDNDWLAQPEDVKALSDRLPNVFDDYRVPFHQWNHLDYLWGIDADTLVYDQLKSNMARAQEMEEQGLLKKN